MNAEQNNKTYHKCYIEVVCFRGKSVVMHNKNMRTSFANFV